MGGISGSIRVSTQVNAEGVSETCLNVSNSTDSPVCFTHDQVRAAMAQMRVATPVIKSISAVSRPAPSSPTLQRLVPLERTVIMMDRAESVSPPKGTQLADGSVKITLNLSQSPTWSADVVSMVTANTGLSELDARAWLSATAMVRETKNGNGNIESTEAAVREIVTSGGSLDAYGASGLSGKEGQEFVYKYTGIQDGELFGVD